MEKVIKKYFKSIYIYIYIINIATEEEVVWVAIWGKVSACNAFKFKWWNIYFLSHHTAWCIWFCRILFAQAAFKITPNDLSMESRRWSLFRARRSHVEQLGRRLYQAPLLAFHTATWDASPAVRAHISAPATIYWRQIFRESPLLGSRRLSAWKSKVLKRVSSQTR